MGIKIICIETFVPRDEEDDLPINSDRGSSSHVAHSRRELEPKYTLAHESHLLNVTILEK